jgi:hypothetical protein
MRANSIKNLDDVRIAIQKLQNWQQTFQNSPLDYHGLRITNAGNSVDGQDYVTRNELLGQQGTGATAKQHYTAIFDLQGVAMTGDLTPSFVVQTGREGIPISAWVTATIPPPSGDFIADIYYQGTQVSSGTKILSSSLDLPEGSTAVIVDNQFVLPAPTLGTLTKIWVQVVNGGGASLVSVGLVIQRLTNAGS